MKFLECPNLGRRPITEFEFGGRLESEPAELDMPAARWAFEQDSRPMICSEWWYHRSSKQWFQIERDTQKNVVIKTLKYE